MNSDQFLDAVNRVLRPALEPLGYRVSTKVSGRAYGAECAMDDHVAIVSFEPGDSYLLVAVLSIEHGVRSNLDDRMASPRLGDLNRRFLTNADIRLLDQHRQADISSDAETTKVVAAMRQLCCVLPRYADARRDV